MHRRRLLALAVGSVATVLAGCVQYLPGDGGSRSSDGADQTAGGARAAADVDVYNLRDRSSTASIEVTNLETGETALEQTVEVEPGGRREFANPVLHGGAYEVTVSVQDGPERTAEWRDVGGALQILLQADVVTLGEEIE